MYGVFNKAAQADASAKLQSCKSVNCSTLHSIIYSQHPELKGNWKTQGGEWSLSDLKQHDWEELVIKECGQDIDQFLLGASGQPPTTQQAQKRFRRDQELCAFWIYKTFLNFLSKKGGKDKLGPTNLRDDGVGKLTYYPVVVNSERAEGGTEQEGGGRNEKKGKKLRLGAAGKKPGTFYTSQALRLWELQIERRQFLGHDCYMKYAEVTRFLLQHYDSILLDESQDLTESQVETFVVQQPHADVYIVGDAVQSLYSWRGAIPGQLRDLSKRVAPRVVKEDLQLTQSHRFGQGIASIANHMLFIKKHSAQHSMWHHYTIVGVGPPTISVSSAALTGRRTVIGRSNVGLCIEAFKLMDDPSLRIGILGSSSYPTFEQICKDVEKLLPNYNSERPFKFRGVEYDSWADFEQEVEDREMPVGSVLGLLHKYADGSQGSQGTAAEDGGGEDAGADHILLELIAGFRKKVLQRRVPEDQCDVLLATACQAKGLEWDDVKVLDDFRPLVRFESVPDEDLAKDATKATAAAEARARGSELMQFKLTGDRKGDELNSWYVAVTRPRLRLQLPEKFSALEGWLSSGEMALQQESSQSSKEEESYSPKQKRGIEELRQRMIEALCPAQGPSQRASPGAPSGVRAAADSPSGATPAVRAMHFGSQ